jgi:hypothetical protein
MRIVDHALAAFEKSAEEGVSEVTSHTIESADDCGKLEVSGRSVTHRVRKDAGDVRFLEVAMKALREIRDLFKIGAEAETKLQAVVPDGGPALEALGQTGTIRITTKWGQPAIGAQPRRPAVEPEVCTVKNEGG